MMALLSPLMAWGALLGAIPIIIHLLNRRRFRRVEWAPMRLLKLTLQRNRRRIQLEELLLLLLRVAVLVLLFLLLARPVLNPTGLEGWLGGAGRSSEVVLVDDSLSMGYAMDGPDAFGRAQDVAAGLVGALRSQDRVTLLTSSRPGSPLLMEVEGADREAIADALTLLEPSATHASWSAVLNGVDEVLATCAFPVRQITIVTDLRAAGWDEGVGPFARDWEERGLRLRVVDVGQDDAVNVSIRGLAPLDRTILAGVESRWEALLRNDSAGTLAEGKAVLRVDGSPTELNLPEVAPGQSARVPIEVRFSGAGPHDLALELPDDELPGDNQAYAAVPVRDSLLIRLVDGEPSTEPFGSEVDYLAAPLSIGVGAAEAWRVEVAAEDDFLDPRREVPDLLVLANVAAPTPDQADRLGELVRDGMGLMIFTGDRIDAELYSDLLGPDGAGLLPAAMVGPLGREVRGLIVESVRPSPLEALLQLKPAALERVAARQVMGVEEPAEGDSAGRVLARWNDPGRSPAVIDRTVGDGRVLLWTTTADRDGSDWPIEPSFVLAVREAVLGASRPTPGGRTINAGEAARRLIRTSQPIADARVEPPGGAEPRALPVVPLPDEEAGDLGPASAVALPDTRRAGLYRLSWTEGILGAHSDVFAVNPDPRESELNRIAQDDLRALLRPLDVEVATVSGGAADLFSPTGREIWRELVALLLVLLVAEPALAAWAGRSR